MSQINQLNISGITLTFLGEDISTVLLDRCFIPFTEKTESFICIPVIISNIPINCTQGGYTHKFDTTKVILSHDFSNAYIVGTMPMDRLLFSKCLSFLICIVLSAFQGIILHASIVSYKNQALLFSGNSGQGKSTQATLWSKFADAKILNHDKALIRYDNTWKSYGSPWSGETHCYVNQSSPVKAIIFLEHGTRNELIPLDAKRALTMLFSQLRFFFDQIFF